MKYHKNIYLILVFNFLSLLHFYSIILVLLLLSKNYSLTTIGLFFGIYQVTKLVLEIPTGIISDRVGRKLSTIISQTTLILFLLLLLQDNNIYVLVACAILYGVSTAFSSGSIDCLFVETINETCPNDMQKLNSIDSFICTTSFALAFLIGGYLGSIDYKLAIFATIIVQIVTLIILVYIKESKRNIIHKSHYSQFVATLKFIYKDDSIMYWMTLPAIVAVILIPFEDFYPAFLSEYGISESYIGVIISINVIISAVVGLISYRIANIIGTDFTVRKLIYGIPIGFILMYFFRDYVLFTIIVYSFILSISTVNIITRYSIIQNRIIDEYRGTVTSIRGLILAIIAMFIAPLTGYLSDNYGYSFAFLICSLITLVLIIVNNLKFKSVRF